MDGQISIFDIMYPKFKIDKPIRLIELFSGYGSQALALKYLGVPFEHWKTCEWAIKSIQAYKDIHMTDDNADYSKDLTEEQIKEYLYNKGISQNYNEPMSKEQVKRLSNVRTIYNNIQATHNLVNIQQVKGVDLDIKDTDKYEYILTYSFPCQDLSLAGLGKGMNDTSTRSGMLWEVERILTECKEKPQILLMENVPQVHQTGDNAKNFHKWQVRLEEMGYKNYMQDLIATDYGIPQTRNRCFMVSILGDYSYTFPNPIPLKLKLKDMLEDQVDEKYYLSDKCIKTMLKHDIDYKPTGLAPTLTTELAHHTGKNFTPKIIREIDYSLKIKNATKQGYLEAEEGDGVDISTRMQHHRGTVQKDKTQTLTTMGGENNGVVVLKRDLCNKLVQDGLVEEGDVVKHSFTQQILDGNKKCVEKNDGNMITLTTRGDCVGVCVNSVYTEIEKQLFTENGNIRRYIDSDIIDKFEEGQVATTTYPNGYGHGPRTHNECVALNTIDKPSVKQNLRIRKLTPKECFRLMGVKDEDYENCAEKQSNASLYHLAGDSICTGCLIAIFGELLGINWQDKLQEMLY